MRKALFIFVLTLPVLFVVQAPAADSAPALLPKVFAGWTKTDSQISKDAAAADATNAALLKEDGFTDFERAEYTQPDRKCSIKAIRFADASGAYSAFTSYTPEEVESIDMGPKNKDSMGFSRGNVITFFRQNILVTVSFDRITPMTPGVVRELASSLPETSTTNQILPTTPNYLPRVKQSFIPSSLRFFMGPGALALAGSPAPDQVIGLSKGASVEGAIARYKTSEGTATMMVLRYPTNAIAGERERAITTYQPSTPASSDVAPPFTVKRTGPLVVLTAGKISTDEAKSLLAQVNYEVEVTYNQNTRMDNYAGFLVSLLALIGIILVLSIVAGFAFGGFRVLINRLFPGRFFDRTKDVEVIQLNIRK